MKQYDLAEGMRMYIARLREQGRYSSAKSYQDALNSFLRFCGQEVIPYTRIDREMLLRYQDYLRDRECSWNTVSTYMRRIRRVGWRWRMGRLLFPVICSRGFSWE